MKERLLCIATIIYFIGILMGLYLKLSMALFVMLGILVIVIAYLNIGKTGGKRKYLLKLIGIGLILIIGIINVKQIDNTYERFYEEIGTLEEVKIEAIVLEYMEEKDYSRAYKIEVLKINGNDQYSGYEIILNLKKSKSKENINLECGDYIIVKGEFKIPSRARNYGGFDYAKYLKEKNIYGTINVKDDIEVIKKNVGNIGNRIINELQESIKNNIRKILPEETSELCVGILIGIRNDLTEEIEANFKKSNLTHMLAVSGSHISYIILGLTLLLSKTDKQFSRVITIFFLMFFMALTKFTPSVMRACIMGIIMIISKLIYKKSDIWNSLLLSGLIILVLNPYIIMDIGFQLSFGGTIGIILLSKRVSNYIKGKINAENKIVNYIIEALALTLAANIIIIPIMAYNFNTISITFWISNLLASPFMGLVVIVGFFAYIASITSISIAKIIAIPLNIVLILLIKIAEICSQIPFSAIVIKTPHIVSIVIYYVIVILILNYKWIREKISKEKLQYIKRKIGKIVKTKVIFTYIICITLILSSIIGIATYNIKNKLTIYFIDVGQGDSTLIISPSNKKILIDGGGSEMGTFNVGEKILLPYLLDRRITTLDYVLISHFDTDHVGGIIYILEKIRVRNVIVCKQGEHSKNYENFKEIARNKEINIILAKQGDKIRIDKDVYLDILFPENELIEENVLNNNSIVAKLHYKEFSALFTGDIEEIAEERLIEKYKNTNYLKSTLLKVAHHGSKSSSIQEILDYIKPQIALIGVRRNK